MNDWDRVIAAVVARRSELGLTQKELALKAGVAERTIQNLEAGKRPQPLIRGKIERALGWPAGEMRRIADAPDPEPERDVLAERWGREDADRVRAMMRRHLPPGAASQLISEMEREFTAPAEAPSPK